MKKNIYCFITLAFLFVESVESNTTTVSAFPGQTDGVKTTVSGTLTDVNAALVGTHAGRYESGFVVSLAGSTPSFSACCKLPSVPIGKKATIEDSSVQIAVNITKNQIDWPVWNPRSSTCQSATDEWNHWIQDVVYPHEAGHQTVAMNFLNQSNIEPYFSSEDFTETSDCVGLLSNPEIQAQNKIKSRLLAIGKTINSDLKQLQKDYHDRVGEKIPGMDVKKECP